MSLGRRGPSLGAVALLAIVVAILLTGGEESGEDRLPPPGEAESAEVTRVVDGDTIRVDLDGIEEPVRYIGVDTPESVVPDQPVECYGPEAARANARMVEGEEVRLVFDAERRDRYDRLLAYVYREQTFVNAELVRRGFATTLTIAPNDRFADRLDRLEQAAGRAGRGLWGAC